MTETFRNKNPSDFGARQIEFLELLEESSCYHFKKKNPLVINPSLSSLIFRKNHAYLNYETKLHMVLLGMVGRFAKMWVWTALQLMICINTNGVRRGGGKKLY